MLQEKYSNAFLGAGPEETHFALELTYNYGVDSYDIGTGFGHFALAHPDVYALVDSIKKEGVSYCHMYHTSPTLLRLKLLEQNHATCIMQWVCDAAGI